MVTILFFTGLRAGELRSFTQLTLLNLLENGNGDILQPKTQAFRKIVLSDHGKNVLQAMRDDILLICPEENSLLFPFKDSKGNKLIEFINQRLQPYAQRFGLKFTYFHFSN